MNALKHAHPSIFSQWQRLTVVIADSYTPVHPHTTGRRLPDQVCDQSDATERGLTVDERQALADFNSDW